MSARKTKQPAVGRWLTALELADEKYGRARALKENGRLRTERLAREAAAGVADASPAPKTRVRVQRVVRVSSRGWWLVYRRYPDDGAEEKVALVLGKKAARAELVFNRRSFVRGKGVRHYARKASDLDFAWWAGAENSNDPSSATREETL